MKISGKNAKKGILISKRKIGRESAKFEGKYNRKSLRGLILPSLRIEKKVLLQRGRKFSLCEDNTRLVQGGETTKVGIEVKRQSFFFVSQFVSIAFCWRKKGKRW